jgi:endonuclease/exonuclease/phosphatase family metal-dependent hydrolase
LSRKGPGLLLRDIASGDDPQVIAVLDIIKHAQPDVIALQGFDYDLTNLALRLFADQAGYPHIFAARPNTGMATGLDLNGDGRLGGPNDAQGYGRFSGHRGKAVMSKFPINAAKVQNFSALLWRVVPYPSLPVLNGKPFLTAEVLGTQRLPNTGHWIVPIDGPNGPFHLMTFHATPPVFDGPEDRNGNRNHDEIRLWQQYLDGHVGEPIATPFVITGDANLDPNTGEGRRRAIINLLADKRVQDAKPRGDSPTQDTDTVDWSEPRPGNMRVDYVLPSVEWTITDSGVLWPQPNDPLADVAKTASRHHLVWVDITR